MKSQLASKPETAGEATPGPFASFVRFVVCGGGIGLLSSAAVALLAGVMPWVMANAVITVASTILCTELHALFTFGTGKRAGWRQHWQSAGSATAAYAVTSLAMLILHLVQSSPGLLTEQIVYLSASGLAGIGRFLVLRLFVFAGGRAVSVPASIPAQRQREPQERVAMVSGVRGSSRCVTAGPFGGQVLGASADRHERERSASARLVGGNRAIGSAAACRGTARKASSCRRRTASAPASAPAPASEPVSALVPAPASLPNRVLAPVPLAVGS
jgi:putative flippase GtrA